MTLRFIYRASATRDPGSVSEAESDEENEEGDYTVYECPGLAPVSYIYFMIHISYKSFSIGLISLDDDATPYALHAGIISTRNG